MPASTTRPWHLLPVGLIALLWHLVAAADYVAVRLGLSAYTDRLPADWLAFLGTLPLWAGVLWALAVWGGLLGAVLLLMAERGAVLVLAIAFLAALGAAIALPVLSAPVPPVAGRPGALLVGAAVLVPCLLWLYARSLKSRAALD
jgi:hypothetical protein